MPFRRVLEEWKKRIEERRRWRRVGGMVCEENVKPVGLGAPVERVPVKVLWVVLGVLGIRNCVRRTGRVAIWNLVAVRDAARPFRSIFGGRRRTTVLFVPLTSE